MYQLGLLITVLITIGVESATVYPRSYDSSGYSSTIANLNENSLYGRGYSNGYSSGATFTDPTRYPNYSPSYGYTTPGYTSYSTTRYPGYNTNGYSTNSLYSGVSGSNYNQGFNSYGSGYGTGLGSNYGTGMGSSYGTGLGSSYGTSFGSSYGTSLGPSYGTGLGSSYGTGLGSSYGTGLGSRYGTGLGSNYGTGLGVGSGSSYGLGSGSRYGSSYGSGLGSSYGSGLGSSYGSGLGSNYGTGYASDYSNYGSGNTLGGYSPYEVPFMRDQGGYCINRGPQNGIYVDSLMGMWYGVEYIQHRGVDTQLIQNSRDYYRRTCIVIHISEPMDRPSTENQPFHQQTINAKFRQQYRHLRLLWDEAGQTTEYALYFRNDSAGHWQAFGTQNGSMAMRTNYKHFSGTVQVLKAVNDQLVLNFCEEGSPMKPGQLYSVLFSRNPGEMGQWEVELVHTMLQNKRLSTVSRRMVCGNSAHRTTIRVLLSILTCALALFIRSY